MKIVILILFIGLLPFNSISEINSFHNDKYSSFNSRLDKSISFIKPEIISDVDMSKMIGGCGGSKCTNLFHSCNGVGCSPLSVSVCTSGSGNCIQNVRFVACACPIFDEYIIGCP
jgi:hypothetical protein